MGAVDEREAMSTAMKPQKEFLELKIGLQSSWDKNVLLSFPVRFAFTQLKHLMDAN